MKAMERLTISSIESKKRFVLQAYLREHPHPPGTSYQSVLPPRPHTNPAWEMPPPPCAVDKEDTTKRDKQNNKELGKQPINNSQNLGV